MCPKDGSLVPGPREPRTKRGNSAVVNLSATSRAIFAPAKASSYIRSSIPYSARFAQLAPKVFVSIASTPAKR